MSNGIDLNKYYVEAVISDLRHTEQEIKLPIKISSLNKALIEFNIITENKLSVETFDGKFKSVKRIKKLNKLKIERPTNIYYLNEYLDLLKEKNILLETDMKLNTIILKEKISKLLNHENSDLTLKEIRALRTEIKQQENSKEINSSEENNEPKIETREQVNKKEKPMFRIKDILRRQRERKSKNEK